MLAYATRTLPVVLRAWARQDGSLTSTIRGWVRPGQVDVNLHMNQAVYAEAFELGRVDWIVRSGGWDRWRRSGVNPVVAEQRIVYRRELRAFTRYTIDTRATAVDGRLLLVEGHLLVAGQVHARCEVRLIFVGSDGVLDAAAASEVTEGLITDPLEVRDWRVVSGPRG